MPRSRPAWSARRTGVISMAAAGVIALTMSGCTGAPEPTPTPSAATDAAEPIFASDEEALAAAEEAYERYRATSAEISADGGSDPERIDPVVTTEYAETLHEEFAAFRKLGLTMVGSTGIDTVTLAEANVDSKHAEVSIYLCRDVTNVKVIGPDGADVTPADREDRVPTHAFLVSSDSDPHTLLVDGVSRWSGDNFC